MMDLQKLFSLQKKLDDRIALEHQLQGNPLINERILALQVEVAELANETKCFKFWSNKPASSRSVLLEEYVDGIHFILSLGLAFQFTNIEIDNLTIVKAESLVEGFLEVTANIMNFKMNPSADNYIALFSSYIALGKGLGFMPEEVEQAYVEKNNVNHQRQDDGY